MKKTPEDVIILHKCTKNNNHMMYASWDMEYERQNFLSFWAILCPFPPQNQNEKDIWRDYSFMNVYHKWRWYNVWFLRYRDIRCNRQNFLLFWNIFLPFYPPNNLENQNFEKMKKSTLVYHKWWSCDVWSLRHGAWQI